MMDFFSNKLQSNQNTLTIFTFLMYLLGAGIISALGLCIYLIYTLTINLSGIYLYYSYSLIAILIISIVPLFYILSEFNNWKTKEMDKIIRASKILGISKPENKIMEVLMPYQAKKLINIVKLSESDKKDSSPVFAVVPDTSTGLFLFKTKKDVVVYRDNLSEEKLIAIEDGKKIIIANITDKNLIQKLINDKKKLFYKILPPILFMTFLFFVPFLSFDLIDIYNNIYFAEQSTRWEIKDANIIYSDIKQVKITKGKKNYDGYEAVVIYEFEVNEKKYKGNKIYFGYEPTINPEPAQNIINKYPVGVNVNITYNPEKPKLSVLENSDIKALKIKLYHYKIMIFILIVTILIAIIISFLIIPFSFQQYAKKIIQIMEEEEKSRII